jgi:endonuclease YncB( thermonuclease family)
MKRTIILTAGTALLLAACGSPSTAPVAAPTTPQPTTDSPSPTPTVVEPSGVGLATVERWVDGDTLETSLGKVRIAGIDTPESDECQFAEATAKATALVPVGGVVRLVQADAADDKDKYGRWIRYVDGPSGDVGLALIEADLADARYDSRDGYGAHPREAEYVAADPAGDAGTCKATPAPKPSTSKAPKPKPSAPADQAPNIRDADSDGWVCE